MNLESKECKDALKNYDTKNDIEKLAIKVLLEKPENVVNIPELQDISSDEIDKLSLTILKIRNNLGTSFH